MNYTKSWVGQNSEWDFHWNIWVVVTVLYNHSNDCYTTPYYYFLIEQLVRCIHCSTWVILKSCLITFYNKHNICQIKNVRFPCTECGCNPTGSTSFSCVDEQCICKEQYAGKQCNICNTGYYEDQKECHGKNQSYANY